MTERSSSHKSEGRQSATSQSNPVSRLNSLGYEGRQSALTPVTPVGPPLGLFHLGPLPSIIRCWLSTNFSNESLLYAAICTGSCKSTLASSLVNSLGLGDQITIINSESKVKVQVYLPEATVQQSSSRPDSPAPLLPALTVDFFVQDVPVKDASIQIIMGSDVLRARNGDILFSQNRLTIFDDERNKVAVPLVRPESAFVFQGLVTVNSMRSSAVDARPSRTALYSHAATTNGSAETTDNSFTVRSTSSLLGSKVDFKSVDAAGSDYSPVSAPSKQPSVIGEGRTSVTTQQNGRSESPAQSESHMNDYGSIIDGTTPDTPSRGDTGSMWGSWRRDSMQSNRPDSSFSSVASNSGYQRAGRGRGMKILKPARSTVSSRSTSITQTTSSADTMAARSFDNHTRPIKHNTNEVVDGQSPGPLQRSSSSEAKSPIQPLTHKSRSANPVGGASAFGWLNSSQQRQPSAPMD